MRRREFLRVAGGAAASWPVVARAQQPKMPVIGFLHGSSATTSTDLAAAFREGLRNSGYDEGRNVTIEYLWADGQPDRLPILAAELVTKRVSVIVAGPTVAALAAKSTTSTIPIFFITSDNPVKLGLVESVNRPGANVTGVNFLGNETGTKRLDLIREMVPTAKKVGLLLNPGSPPGAAALAEMQSATQKLDYQVQVEHVRSETDVGTAFAAFAAWKA